jgi:hypothetical protein
MKVTFTETIFSQLSKQFKNYNDKIWFQYHHTVELFLILDKYPFRSI